MGITQSNCRLVCPLPALGALLLTWAMLLVEIAAETLQSTPEADKIQFAWTSAWMHAGLQQAMALDFMITPIICLDQFVVGYKNEV